MRALRLLLRIIALTIAMLLIYWTGLEAGKYFYSQMTSWTWAFDRQALWNLYLMVWVGIFFIYNFILLAISKMKNKNTYALLVAILAGVIPLAFFRTAAGIRPMSVLAAHLAALPALSFRLWIFMKWENSK